MNYGLQFQLMTLGTSKLMHVLNLVRRLFSQESVRCCSIRGVSESGSSHSDSEGHSLEDPLNINPCRSKSSFIEVRTVVGLFV